MVTDVASLVRTWEHVKGFHYKLCAKTVTVVPQVSNGGPTVSWDYMCRAWR